jgi:hypothetical protein
MSTTGQLSQLTLPNIDLASGHQSEIEPASADSGRYLSWLSITPNVSRQILVYDMQTQGLVDPTGRTVPFTGDYAIALAPDQVINTFTLPAQFTIANPPTINTILINPATIGILVERVQGTTVLAGRRVPRLVRVGRVPLGLHRKGHDRIRWNGRVNGRPLKPGTYKITLRVLRGTSIAELSRPVTVHITG